MGDFILFLRPPRSLYKKVLKHELSCQQETWLVESALAPPPLINPTPAKRNRPLVSALNIPTSACTPVPDVAWSTPKSASSVQFSHSVVSDYLRPHGLQHARLPCPSPTPVVHWRREWQTISVFLHWEPREQHEKANQQSPVLSWDQDTGHFPTPLVSLHVTISSTSASERPPLGKANFWTLGSFGCFFFCLAVPCMWDLSSPTRNGAHTSCIGSTKS